MNTDQFKKIAALVKGGERYLVYDYVMPGFAVSLTELNTQKETVGHSHQGEEVYIFIEGEGQIMVGEDVSSIKEKDVTLIHRGVFHRVINLGNKKLKFYSVFGRRATKERASAREETTSPERADGKEKTKDGERAEEDEKTRGLERAIKNEKTKRDERIILPKIYSWR